MPNQLGKRYFCAVCGSEFIVTRAGTGSLICCGQPMAIRGAAPSAQAAAPAPAASATKETA